eukprot:4187284-Pyramimonas_sp.AAC.1
MSELLKTAGAHGAEPQGLGVFDADQLAAPQRPARPNPLESVLTGLALQPRLHSERRLERSAAEIEARV